MAKYVGQEHTMYLKICKKYNVQPEPEISAGGGKITLIRFLTFLVISVSVMAPSRLLFQALPSPKRRKGRKRLPPSAAASAPVALASDRPAAVCLELPAPAPWEWRKQRPSVVPQGLGHRPLHLRHLVVPCHPHPCRRRHLEAGKTVKPDLLGKLEKWTVD